MPEARNRGPGLDRRASANPYEFLNRCEALANKSTNTKIVPAQAESEMTPQQQEKKNPGPNNRGQRKGKLGRK